MNSRYLALRSFLTAAPDLRGGLPIGATVLIFSTTAGSNIPVIPINLTGFMPSVYKRALAAGCEMPSLSAISLMVNSFIIIQYTVFLKNVNSNSYGIVIFYGILLHGYKVETRKFVKKSENIFEKLLTKYNYNDRIRI
jgi:hypothetical protein